MRMGWKFASSRVPASGIYQLVRPTTADCRLYSFAISNTRERRCLVICILVCCKKCLYLGISIFTMYVCTIITKNKLNRFINPYSSTNFSFMRINCIFYQTVEAFTAFIIQKIVVSGHRNRGRAVKTFLNQYVRVCRTETQTIY